MRHALSTVALLALLAGCGVPQEESKQAEQLASVAAEGGLLAHDAGTGSTTRAFTRVHADALREQLAPLDAAVERDELAALLDRTDAALEELAAHPEDEAGARELERELEDVAHAARELAG